MFVDKCTNHVVGYTNALHDSVPLLLLLLVQLGLYTRHGGARKKKGVSFEPALWGCLRVDDLKRNMLTLCPRVIITPSSLKCHSDVRGCRTREGAQVLAARFSQEGKGGGKGGADSSRDLSWAVVGASGNRVRVRFMTTRGDGGGGRVFAVSCRNSPFT